MAKRGFFAEINYQAKLQVAETEKAKRQQQAGVDRVRAAAKEEVARARQAERRALAAARRAPAEERKAAEKRAAALFVDSRLAEVASLNADLASDREEIDGLLAWTLEVDDYVDLDGLKITTVQHPPFLPGAVGVPTQDVPQLVLPPEPEYREPPAPSGLGAVLGGKKVVTITTRGQARPGPPPTARLRTVSA